MEIPEYLAREGGYERMRKVHALVEQIEVERGDANLLRRKWWG